MARIIARPISEVLRQDVIVENVPCAGEIVSSGANRAHGATERSAKSSSHSRPLKRARNYDLGFGARLSPLGTILSKRLSIDFVASVGKFVQENNQ